MSSTLVQSSIGSTVSSSSSAGCWNFSPVTKTPSPVPSSTSSPSSSPTPLSPEQEEEVSPSMSTTHHRGGHQQHHHHRHHHHDHRQHGFYSMESGSENNLVPKAELRDLLRSDNGSVLISVYYFIKNFIGGGQTASSGVTIDTKIEEALDLVKSNLMFAVREEVDTLKEQIDVLMNKVTGWNLKIEFFERTPRLRHLQCWTGLKDALCLISAGVDLLDNPCPSL